MTKKDLKHLKKDQLQKALIDVLNWHENHYEAVKNRTEDLQSAFFQLAGTMRAIREINKLPKLYQHEK